jgi:hypothetical protein
VLRGLSINGQGGESSSRAGGCALRIRLRNLQHGLERHRQLRGGSEMIIVDSIVRDNNGTGIGIPPTHPLSSITCAASTIIRRLLYRSGGTEATATTPTASSPGMRERISVDTAFNSTTYVQVGVPRWQ